VQGYLVKASWGFPKGKVNQDEAPVDCAVREVRCIFIIFCYAILIIFQHQLEPNFCWLKVPRNKGSLLPHVIIS